MKKRYVRTGMFMENMRLQKYIADAGITSRRKAEEAKFTREGIRVNGKNNRRIRIQSRS
ncbi:MAG: hypothetical protein ACLTXR_00015 [Clostridia bacterium]